MEISHTTVINSVGCKIQFTIDGIVYKGANWSRSLPEDLKMYHEINLEEEICNIITSMVVTEYIIRNIDRDNSDIEIIKSNIANYITTHVLPNLPL